MTAATTKRRTKPATPEPGASVLTTYPMYVPPLDAPPASAFWRCRCGTLLIERIWHNRSEAMEAHWEICDPPITAVCGRPHTQGGACQPLSLETATPTLPSEKQGGRLRDETSALATSDASIPQRGEETSPETATPPPARDADEGVFPDSNHPDEVYAEQDNETSTKTNALGGDGPREGEDVDPNAGHSGPASGSEAV